MIEILGEMFIGADAIRGSDGVIHGVNPANGTILEPPFGGADDSNVERACFLAQTAFDEYQRAPLDVRANFLRTIATKIEDIGEALIARAVAETGLTPGRLEGELARTTTQLRLFADLAASGDWIEARIDPSLPDRKPAPRPDLRQRHIGIGPVAVFGASNFPFAFSVAGGDTASALAAGCPVVVKAHSAHPGVSELVARAVQAAVEEAGLPSGVFSLLFGKDNALGSKLVCDERIKAVGFTGSRGGGLALMALAAARAQPIPVYAEMSSINPVLILPHALHSRGTQIAFDFVASVTLGAGQFCTKPGLVLLLEGEAGDAFALAAGEAVAKASAGTMLTPEIRAAFTNGTAKLSQHAAVTTLGSGAGGETYGGQAMLFQTSAADFTADRDLQEEVFGASAVVVRCPSIEVMEKLLNSLDGQLTITLQMDADDAEAAHVLIPTLEKKAGRIIINGFPTGVEVSDAIVHGGPFPATSDGRSTSVGTLAIRRFLRPVCYQNFPQALLPLELRDGNPAKIWRRVAGVPGKS